MRTFGILFLFTLLAIFAKCDEIFSHSRCSACTKKYGEGLCAKRTGSYCTSGSSYKPDNGSARCDNWIYYESRCDEQYTNKCNTKTSCDKCTSLQHCVYMKYSLFNSGPDCVPGSNTGAERWTGKYTSTTIYYGSECSALSSGPAGFIIFLAFGCMILFIVGLIIVGDRSKRGKKRRKNIAHQLKYLFSSGGSRRRANIKKDFKKQQKKAKKQEKQMMGQHMQGIMMVPMSSQPLQPQMVQQPIGTAQNVQPVMMNQGNYRY
eukprot:TRINITY_DN206_c0_g1_i2.p1 TRINITY_DN206_c0_g1~~TRINITY_DN206_c0_g1_i2.p1  ORF type:complete len:262 (+),score=40.71 TRINITY_DN206_c0_g1_i2:176-961(+)